MGPRFKSVLGSQIKCHHPDKMVLLILSGFLFSPAQDPLSAGKNCLLLPALNRVSIISMKLMVYHRNFEFDLKPEMRNNKNLIKMFQGDKMTQASNTPVHPIRLTQCVKGAG
jgi:hypothetical protein